MAKRKLNSFYVIALLACSVSVQAATKAQLDYLVSKMRSEDEKKSSKAAVQLAKYGSEAIAVLPDLLRILREPGIHLYVGGVVEYIIAEEPVEIIIELINDENSMVQSLAVEFLKNRHLETNQMLNIYTDLLLHKNPYVRLQAIDALCEMGSEELCLDVVIELASDESSLVRAMAVSKIGEIGIANDRIKSILLNSFNEPDRRERVKAALIYQQLYPKENKGIGQLHNLMKDEDRNVRWHAVQAVGDLKEVDTQTMDLAIKLLDDDDSLVVIRACYAMIRHGVQVSRARDLLIDSLKKEEEFLEVISGLSVLRKLGADAKSYEDRLIEMVNADDELVQVVAIGILGEIDPSKEKVIPLLNRILRTTDDFLVWNMTNKTIQELTGSDH